MPELKRLWAICLASDRMQRQDRQLVRLDLAQKIAQANGIGRDALNKVYGRAVWPDPPVIDDADLLDLPKTGTLTDPVRIRALLGPNIFVMEPEARPPWIPPTESWPPPK